MMIRDTLVTAKWCEPCKVIKAFLKDNPKDIVIIDADENFEYCKQWKVSSVPTLVTPDKKIIGSKDIINYLAQLSDDYFDQRIQNL